PVLSLAGGSPRIQAGFHVPDPTRVPTRAASDGLTGLSPAPAALSSALQSSSAVPRRRPHDPAGCPRRFRLFPVRSPLLRESRLLSFPAGTEMFQFPALWWRPRDQHLFGGSPGPFAAFHVHNPDDAQASPPRPWGLDHADLRPRLAARPGRHDRP